MKMRIDACPRCGRAVPVRKDGSMRAHTCPHQQSCVLPGIPQKRLGIEAGVVLPEDDCQKCLRARPALTTRVEGGASC